MLTTRENSKKRLVKPISSVILALFTYHILNIIKESSTNRTAQDKRSAQCQISTDAGLVAVTPDSVNGGWAMAPDCLANQACIVLMLVHQASLWHNGIPKQHLILRLSQLMVGYTATLMVPLRTPSQTNRIVIPVQEPSTVRIKLEHRLRFVKRLCLGKFHITMPNINDKLRRYAHPYRRRRHECPSSP